MAEKRTRKKTKAGCVSSRFPKTVRIGILSLGCPKTLVDSEVILGKLDSKRYRLVDSVADCDVALINTCAFIRDAQQESIDRIWELIELKQEGRIKAIVVIGCLAQRFPEALREELREVDAFLGSGDYSKIPGVVAGVLSGKSIFSFGDPGYLSSKSERRIALTPAFTRYVKISEGCDHRCSFCTIPFFRGKHRSRKIADIVEEAGRLIADGAKEIILVGQDTAYFGRDYSGQFLLPELLRELDRLKGIEWIRVLYAYPSGVTRELMETMRDSRHVCHYLDLALQHASDRILTAMRRGITKERTLRMIERFREAVPDLAIRTSFIVGFPGETEKDFQELLSFMKEVRFERLGVFTYSREEGTEAAAMASQVPEKVKMARLEAAMLLQQKISREFNERMLGKTVRVLMETRDENHPTLWAGRSFMDAPEVDGNVFIRSPRPLKPGCFYNARIEDFKEYDLVGEL